MVPETEKIDFTPIEIPRIRRDYWGYVKIVAALVLVGGMSWAWQTGSLSSLFARSASVPLEFVEVDRGDVEIVVVEQGTLESASNTTVRCEVEALMGTVGGADGGTTKGSTGGGAGGASGTGASGGARRGGRRSRSRRRIGRGFRQQVQGQERIDVEDGIGLDENWGVVLVVLIIIRGCQHIRGVRLIVNGIDGHVGVGRVGIVGRRVIDRGLGQAGHS